MRFVFITFMGVWNLDYGSVSFTEHHFSETRTIVDSNGEKHAFKERDDHKRYADGHVTNSHDDKKIVRDGIVTVETSKDCRNGECAISSRSPPRLGHH